MEINLELAQALYIGATVLFILTLGGLSHPESARKGNLYGMLGMAIAIIATLLGPHVTKNLFLIFILMALGGLIGIYLAKKVKMTHMPELVAILHSLVGIAAVLVGYVNFLDVTVSYQGVEKVIHEIEIYIGIFIGAVTFSGSVIAYGKLSRAISGNPLLLPGRHWLNLILIIVICIYGYIFVTTESVTAATTPLIIMTAVSLILGMHLIMAIGGADMPVAVSMLNSYSGWAASATGFMLGNDLLIVVGALVGSSGAILSYIMCQAMNRSFISVIAGGFGTDGPSANIVTSEDQGEVTAVEPEDVCELLLSSKKVMIIPGYGMAVAQAQHTVNKIVKLLQNRKIEVCFGIHPVAGRMPGHMNVLLAEARVPYDIVFEMDEINEDFPGVDTSIIIGANDIVNPSALDDPNSPIAGMPVLECWKGKTSIVLKRSMATGYAGIQNPLFFKDNTRMLFGDAKASMDSVLTALESS
ncbi:MAG: NAD(P)(+) transhydrogenase (Re/Si-specific) subunit beta [Gammaproteobacteria bacterium]|nr:NAD(P)(+) transhydrogenase (Re/Si-specific) subunit beta [Gammaproteobacteria bacterium]